MNITPLTSAVAVPVPPVQDIATDQAKEQKLAEAQTTSKQSVVYFSPVIKIDRSTSTAIMQYRDRATGEVTRQTPPTRSELKAYEPKTEAKAQATIEPVEIAEEDDAPPQQEPVHLTEDA